MVRFVLGEPDEIILVHNHKIFPLARSRVALAISLTRIEQVVGRQYVFHEGLEPAARRLYAHREAGPFIPAVRRVKRRQIGSGLVQRSQPVTVGSIRRTDVLGLVEGVPERVTRVHTKSVVPDDFIDSTVVDDEPEPRFICR